MYLWKTWCVPVKHSSWRKYDGYQVDHIVHFKDRFKFLNQSNSIGGANPKRNERGIAEMAHTSSGSWPTATVGKNRSK